MNEKASSGGIGCLGVAGIVLIILKLTGLLNWSWGWVLAPYWIPFCVMAAVLMLALLFRIAADTFGRR